LRYVDLRALGERSLGNWLVRAALAIPTLYHGAWNLGSEGMLFWTRDSGLPPWLRFIVGGAEICASLAILSGVLSRLAACGLLLIFIGAIPQHYAAGFSFKHGGYEPVVVYALLALALATERPSHRSAIGSSPPAKPNQERSPP
jgi:uncharacterized membrane protein YphA (DoxX/SURF4 family)